MVQEYQFKVTIADGADTITKSDLPINGVLKGWSVTAPDLASTNTYTLTITSRGGVTIYNDSGLSENTTTTKFVDSNNHPFSLPLPPECDVKITSSGTEAGGDEFTVTLFVQT